MHAVLNPSAIIRDAINAHCRGDYDIIERESAIRALTEGRPCLLNTGGYHNQVAGLVSEAVNEGDSLIVYIERQAIKFGPASRYAQRFWWAVNILNCLYPVNRAGEAELEQARWWCAEAPSSIAAE